MTLKKGTLFGQANFFEKNKKNLQKQKPFSFSFARFPFYFFDHYFLFFCTNQILKH
jgi:hypothetical protein